MKKIVLGIVALSVIFSGLFVPTSTSHAASNYTDIPTFHRAYQEISYLATNNITTSTSTNTYSPDAAITRAHAVTMIGKAIQLTEDTSASHFSDVPASHFAKGYINEAVNRGIINGYKGGIFKPDQTLNRGDMAVIISRAFGYQSGTTNAAAKELMNKGISQGIGKGDFGSGQLMKRGDFALFLARAINAEFRVGGQALPATPMFVNVAETTSLNFRQGPGVAYAVTKKLYAGYQVSGLYQVGEWLYIKVGNDYGFVNKSFLSTKKPTTSTIKDPVLVGVPPVPKPNNPGSSLSNLVVIVDAGHGGSDPGAGGFGLLEKNIALNIALKTEKYFNQVPLQVKYTRKTDKLISLDDRGRFASQNNGNIFVSIHTNAFNGSAAGQETFYYSAANNPKVNESKALASYVQFRMQEAWKLRDRGVKKGNYAVLRQNTVPSVLAEVGFIDNKSDNRMMANDANREKMARAIFLATLDYYYHYENRSEVGGLYAKFNAKPSGKRH